MPKVSDRQWTPARVDNAIKFLMPREESEVCVVDICANAQKSKINLKPPIIPENNQKNLWVVDSACSSPNDNPLAPAPDDEDEGPVATALDDEDDPLASELKEFDANPLASVLDDFVANDEPNNLEFLTMRR
ncbi:hypothetical protein BDA99DRAFT_561460 [Phascolomyces articulosus]|uniref:Uncharacterized protein n=1 Tax=Phascolomyces articulosus TaxID=60185 RepID=A0AAD5K648_9FUNG|nr:hypothetical protein BDA99DRAFT_561460 [Phascolomyces articulosus]